MKWKEKVVLQMQDKEFDKMLSEALMKKTETVFPNERLYQSIEVKLDRIEKKEKMTMKRLGMKPMIAAAAVIALSATCYGLTQINSYVSHSQRLEIGYDHLSEMEKEVGYSFQSIEQFSNGYTFLDTSAGETEAFDKEGNSVGKVKDVSLSYTNSKDPKGIVSLSIRKTISGEELQIDKYSTQKMVVFPVSDDSDENKWEAEAKEYEAKGYMVSYGGSGEKEENSIESLSWMEDEILYELVGINSNLGEDELKQMQKEIMSNKE